MKPLTRKEFLALTALLAMPQTADAALSTSSRRKTTTTAAMLREKVGPAAPMGAALFPLIDVQLLAGPFRDAMETDRAYLHALDPDRFLAFMRENAGLKPKAPHYGGWDNGGSGMIGHYLSACALMVAAADDAILKQRVEYIASELAACQKAKGDGGLYSYEWDANIYFAQLTQGKVIPVNTSAWYVTHKTFAGLRDAWLHCGSTTARDVLIRMTDWAIQVTSKLTDDQWQEMLGPPDKMGEFGGPHEVFADVYAITGDRKYLILAEKFKHKRVFDPMVQGQTQILNDHHANTEIPKFVGYERIYELTGDPVWHKAASNFWQEVVTHRSWANGGDGQWEHFFAPDQTDTKVNERCGPETCCTYNMLKLTQMLFLHQPSVPYMDYYEKALYNSILPSQAPGGGLVYYTSMRPGHYRVYSRPYDAFWCCVGTGMENHGKYGQMIYAYGPQDLYVNLFIPSVLQWKEKGLTLHQKTTFPEEPKTRLALTLTQPRKMTIHLRCPHWTAPGAMTVRVNGMAVKTKTQPGSFLAITRLWKSGDRIDLTLPMRVTMESLAHSTDYAAFFYGPLLLAAPLGDEGLTHDDFYGGGDNTNIENQLATKTLPINKFPVLVGDANEAAAHIKPVSGKTLTFQTDGLTKPADVTLIPFHQIAFQRYTIYWPIKTAEAYDREQQAVRDLDARTIDHVLLGEPASESEHHLVTDQSSTGIAADPFTYWRDATGGFSYDVKVLPDQPVVLQCSYWGPDTDRTFDILVNDKVIATQTLSGPKPSGYYSEEYPIPEDLTQGKQTVTVRFAAKSGSKAGGLYDLRVLHSR